MNLILLGGGTQYNLQLKKIKMFKKKKNRKKRKSFQKKMLLLLNVSVKTPGNELFF